MLYASLWQVNNDKYSLHESAVIAAKLFEKGAYPPPGVEIIGQWVTTQGRGITIFKCEDPLAVLTEGNVFELEKPGYWKYQETFPVMNLAEGIGATLPYKKVL